MDFSFQHASQLTPGRRDRVADPDIIISRIRLAILKGVKFTLILGVSCFIASFFNFFQCVSLFITQQKVEVPREVYDPRTSPGTESTRLTISRKLRSKLQNCHGITFQRLTAVDRRFGVRCSSSSFSPKCHRDPAEETRLTSASVSCSSEKSISPSASGQNSSGNQIYSYCS